MDCVYCPVRQSCPAAQSTRLRNKSRLGLWVCVPYSREPHGTRHGRILSITGLSLSCKSLVGSNDCRSPERWLQTSCLPTRTLTGCGLIPTTRYTREPCLLRREHLCRPSNLQRSLLSKAFLAACRCSSPVYGSSACVALAADRPLVRPPPPSVCMPCHCPPSLLARRRCSSRPRRLGRACLAEPAGLPNRLQITVAGGASRQRVSAMHVAEAVAAVQAAVHVHTLLCWWPGPAHITLLLRY